MKKLFCLLAAALPVVAAADSVKLYEKDEVIPTYLSGPPDPNPMFFFGRESQGAAGRIYPYPLYDNLTNQRGEKSYHLVYLENEYVKIAIAPEIGGRLLSALDKTDNYDFIYHQHVIKPALIGLIGAWISGGIEWNIPHHHRATTFLPVQWRPAENADGSKTIWVGEMEIRDRMSWAVGYTLHPGSSVLTCSVRILNRTPTAHTMLCFANVAVSANDQYQIIFPPDTQWVTFHAKREFASWPVARSRYAGADFTAGVDVSWWKNHLQANSMFAWNYWDDFFGGYDHGRQAGIVSVADHQVVPGKKFWTWGSGPRGRLWDDILTDTDGPYIELMAGAYSDNQPDYSWLQPFETRAFDMHWYPVQQIDGFKNANLAAAANWSLANGIARFGFCATAPHKNATVRVTAAGKTLLEQNISIQPGAPYTNIVSIPDGTPEHSVRISLSDGARELISYSPVPLTPQPQPEPVAPIPPPKDIPNEEELFLAGQRVEQFHDAHRTPEAYWDEALRRDPGEIQSHLGLGVLDLQQAKYAEAEQHIRAALQRLTARHTTPRDAEPYYYLGLTLKAENKTDEAFDTLSKAAWDQHWKAPACFALAQIAAGRGDFARALEAVNDSLAANTLNVRAAALKAAILRHLGRPAEAADVLAAAAPATDPLDVGLLAESWLSSHDKTVARELFATLNTFPTTAQEAAAECYDAGLWSDGRELLDQSIAAAPDKTRVSPLIYYYLGDFADRLGDANAAREYRRLAARQPADYVFPFQAEMAAVLQRAMDANPGDARAPYYLGNLLFDWQPAAAMSLWEKASALDPAFTMAWRNLAQGYAHQTNADSTAQAIACLEKAVALNDPYPTHYAELDRLYQAAGAPVEKRLALLEQHQAIVAQKDEGRADLIALKTLAGKTDESLSLLEGRTFSLWEGGTQFDTGQEWANAHLVRGLQHLRNQEFQPALDDFLAALKPPKNLRAAEADGTRRAEFGYWQGVAQAGLGQTDEARQSWKNVASIISSPGDRGSDTHRENPEGHYLQRYYQTLAEHKLDPADDVRGAFQELVQAGNSELRPADEGPDNRAPDSPAARRHRAAAAHYISGLGRAGLGEQGKARTEFNAALAAEPDYLGPKLALEQLPTP